jgi:hypothetical protein
MASHGHIWKLSPRRLQNIQPHHPEHSVCRSYLVPWMLWMSWSLLVVVGSGTGTPEHPSRAALRKPWRAYLERWVQRQISVRFILSRKNCPKDLFRVCVNILGTPQRKPQTHWKQSFSLLKPREMEYTAFGRPGDWLKVVGLVGVLVVSCEGWVACCNIPFKPWT